MNYVEKDELFRCFFLFSSQTKDNDKQNKVLPARTNIIYNTFDLI